MNNFDLMTEAQTLADTRSSFSLSKELVQVKELNREMLEFLEDLVTIDDATLYLENSSDLFDLLEKIRGQP